MTVLLNEKTRVIVQGFTGKIGTFHAEEMMEYGTNLVGGVTPGKGGKEHLGKPVFNTVKEAVSEVGAEASIIFVPGAFAADSIMEAADAGIKYCVALMLAPDKTSAFTGSVTVGQNASQFANASCICSLVIGISSTFN